ncbi:HpcH/HpaI aldolase/citrate lyase family protein [Sedimentitalea sp. HM32M-2]|uniref:HpcH/HpaI aldolase family protein n=1 Tax=Sedimentitalea sp. HM32M-2 TaxID=3351566 RepID=UPI0036415908
MPVPLNILKQRFHAGETTFGCWLSFAEPTAAEIMGTAGFDWLVIDGEHAPNDIRSIRDQLLALQASPSPAIVRVPVGEPWMIKQVLDIGAQTVLVPMVESAAQAHQMVRACTYPPQGMRGVGAAGTRSSRFAAIPDYIQTADAQISLIVQVENRAGLAALDDILAVPGIDCVFIGPSDLSTDLGHHGQPAHPEVHDTILSMLTRIAAAGKVPGIMSRSESLTEEYLAAGARFIAVGVDVLTLAQAARDLAARWITPPSA